MSSANLNTELVRPLSRSLMKIRNRIGPNTDPCGTPLVTGLLDEYCPPTHICCQKGFEPRTYRSTGKHATNTATDTEAMKPMMYSMPHCSYLAAGTLSPTDSLPAAGMRYTTKPEVISILDCVESLATANVHFIHFRNIALTNSNN